MHSTSSIYTRQRMGIDNNVWISMLTCIVLSAGLLGYNVSNHRTVKTFSPVDFAVNGRKILDSMTFKTGQVLTFRSGVSAGDEIAWDFGDGTKKETGYDVTHVYTEPGILTVRALVNNQYPFEKKVHIEKEELVPVDYTGTVLESIVGKEEAKTGEQLEFNTMLPAGSYEWRIENNANYPVQKGGKATFRFNTQGNYTVVLILDQDRNKKYMKTVVVTKPADLVIAGGPPKPKVLILPLPKPVDTADRGKPNITAPQVEVAKKNYKYLSNEILTDYLQQVVCNGLKSSEFNDYLCQGENTPVIVNSTERKTFGELCREIQGKKIKVESVIAARDNDKCAINLTVTYHKIGNLLGLGKNPCKN